MADEDVDKLLAEELLARFKAGDSKSALEIEYWDDGTSHGKRFTSFVRKHLGVETESKSRQSQELERLQNLLRRSGVSPTPAGDLSVEDRLVAKAREAALAAVRHYNDPTGGFRTDGFVVWMIIAWNCLLQAILEGKGVDYYDRDDAGEIISINGRSKIRGTWDLLGLALPDEEHRPLRCNIDFFLGLRHLIEHRYIPALDPLVASEAQAMLLNFETTIVAHFGEEAALAGQLTVPLQLSALRPQAQIESLRELEAQIPVDVMDFLARHREKVPVEVLRSHEYALPLFFVPVTANRERSADAVVNFVRPGEVPKESEDTLRRVTVVPKTKPIPVVSADLLRPREVVNLVAERLPFRFTMNSHSKCWRHYGVRPPAGAGEPAATHVDYCLYDKLAGGYGYTAAWVDKLVSDLSDAAVYEEVVGIAPVRM